MNITNDFSYWLARNVKTSQPIIELGRFDISAHGQVLSVGAGKNEVLFLLSSFDSAMLS